MAAPIPKKERHVHWAPDVASASHRPPEAFRKKKPIAVRDPIFSYPCVKSAKSPAAARIFTIRPGVPFDSWFNENGRHRPITATSDLWKARGGAVVALTKGMAFVLVDLVKYLYAAIIGNSTEEQFKDLNAQWHGVQLSAVAIYSPNLAKEHFLKHWADPANCNLPLTFIRA